jgi:hypothetical protein
MRASFQPVGFLIEVEDMAAHSQARNSHRDLTVVFADLHVQQPKAAAPILDLTFMLWPLQVRDAGS